MKNKMKTFKCPNCHKEREKENNIKMVLCGCGYYMEELDSHSDIRNKNKKEVKNENSNKQRRWKRI